MVLSIEDEHFLSKAAKKMTQFIHDKKVGTVIVMGTSAQTTAHQVRSFWKEAYPNEKPPAFVAVGKVKTDRFDDSLYAAPTSSLYDGELEKIIFERGKKHLADKNQRIFLMEESVKHGNTIGRVKNIFRNAGFKKILAGAIVTEKGHLEVSEKGVWGKLDFVGATVPFLDSLINDKVHYKTRRTSTDKLLAYRKRLAIAMKENPAFAKGVRAAFREAVREGRNDIYFHTDFWRKQGEFYSVTEGRRGELVGAAREAISARRRLRAARRR